MKSKGKQALEKDNHNRVPISFQEHPGPLERTVGLCLPAHNGAWRTTERAPSVKGKDAEEGKNDPHLNGAILAHKGKDGDCKEKKTAYEPHQERAPVFLSAGAFS
jgi:hypothetical protein